MSTSASYLTLENQQYTHIFACVANTNDTVINLSQAWNCLHKRNSTV